MYHSTPHFHRACEEFQLQERHWLHSFSFFISGVLLNSSRSGDKGSFVELEGLGGHIQACLPSNALDLNTPVSNSLCNHEDASQLVR